MNKKMLIQKSEYNFPNQLILSSALRRFDKNLYNVKIIEKPNYYIIIATNKIEEV